MKKLNFQFGGIKEMLSKEQMRKVVGGYGNNCTTPQTANVCYTCGMNSPGMADPGTPDWEVAVRVLYNYCFSNYPL